MFLKKFASFVLGLLIGSAVAHKSELVGEVQAVATAANGSPSEQHVNEAIDKVVPAFVRPIVDAELKTYEPELTAALALGAPQFFDAAIAALQKIQVSLSH